MRNCKQCSQLYKCFSHPSNCPLDEEERKQSTTCRLCKHILIEDMKQDDTYPFDVTIATRCPNRDCFYSYFTQDQEVTGERELEIIQLKYKEKHK